jgi:Flp pilus assembly secretin CpaC
MGDIPLFGNLFSERINLRTKRNLLVFVTPTLINQGYGTGLEDQVTGLRDNGSPFADPSGWRNNAKGVVRLIPEDNRQIVSEYPKPGITPVMMRKGSNSSTRTAAKTTTTRPVTTAKGR